MTHTDTASIARTLDTLNAAAPAGTRYLIGYVGLGDRVHLVARAANSRRGVCGAKATSLGDGHGIQADLERVECQKCRKAMLALPVAEPQAEPATPTLWRLALGGRMAHVMVGQAERGVRSAALCGTRLAWWWSYTADELRVVRQCPRCLAKMAAEAQPETVAAEPQADDVDQLRAAYGEAKATWQALRSEDNALNIRDFGGDLDAFRAACDQRAVVIDAAYQAANDAGRRYYAAREAAQDGGPAVVVSCALCMVAQVSLEALEAHVRHRHPEALEAPAPCICGDYHPEGACFPSDPQEGRQDAPGGPTPHLAVRLDPEAVAKLQAALVGIRRTLDAAAADLARLTADRERRCLTVQVPDPSPVRSIHSAAPRFGKALATAMVGLSGVPQRYLVGTGLAGAPGVYTAAAVVAFMGDLQRRQVLLVDRLARDTLGAARPPAPPVPVADEGPPPDRYSRRHGGRHRPAQAWQERRHIPQPQRGHR